MKPKMNVALLGVLLSATACMTQPSTSPDPVDDLETGEQTQSFRGPHPGPDFYITCSDDTNVCTPPYGSVSITPDAACIPYGSSHVVRCEYGSVSL